MAYFCFLCNETHEDSFTEEHFIPRTIDGPERQWLPICEASNTRSNSIFDNDARDILYWVRHINTGALKRSGEAILADGSIKGFKFSYYEGSEPNESTAFRYIYDRETNAHIPQEGVYAIGFPVGLRPDEQKTFCRGLAKISIGALVYLLKEQGEEEKKIRQILLQKTIDMIRHFALDLQRTGERQEMRFSLGRSDVLEKLQRECENTQVRNHVIKIDFQEDNSIQIEGMLYSQYGWVLNLINHISVEECKLRLENAITHMSIPASIRDFTMSPDSIVIVNPEYAGQIPNIPEHWRNN